MNPKVRVRSAQVLVVCSIVLWVLSMFTFAKNEPPVVLSLSWFAITLTAADILSTSDVRKQQDDE